MTYDELFPEPMKHFETYRKGDGKVFNYTFTLLDLKYLFPIVMNTFHYYFCMTSFQKSAVQNIVVGFAFCNYFDLEIFRLALCRIQFLL